MLFINPMWDNEIERIGKQKCTAFGYALHVISDYIGLIGLLLLVAISIYLSYRGMAGTFHSRLLWILAIPLGLAIVGSVVYRYSWFLAYRKGFSDDFDAREAIWIENGQRQTFKWTS